MEKTLYNEQVYAIEPKLNEPTDIGRETNPYHNLFLDGDIYSEGAKKYTTVEETEIIKSQTFESLTAVNAHITNLTASKASVADLSATNATIGTLEASKANITDLEAVEADIVLLNASKANIMDLDVIRANIDTLEANKATITELNVEKGRINTLTSTKADIGDLVAEKIKVNLLDGNTAILQTILTNFISGTSGQFVHLTGSNTVIDNAIIKDAMIDTLSLNKLLAGDISTNKFRIVSTSGQLIISDNTIQIKDSARTRVQIGKDASNDYNMYVWDKDGNLMFDATGLKAGGIKDKIIRNDMISDTANISGSKIDIASLITSINNDGSTTIKGSKVKLDETGQTLNVAFNKLTTTVSDISVGTRNLMLNSSESYVVTGELGKAKTKGLTLCPWIVDNCSLLRNQYLVLSFDAKTTDLVYGTTNAYIGFELQVHGTTSQYLGIGGTKITAGTSSAFKSYYSLVKVNDMDINRISVSYTTRDFTGSVEIKNLSIVIGNKYVGWTPAPEDTDNKIGVATENVFNDLSIGGRNLWKFTKEYDGTKYDGWVDNNDATRRSVAPFTTVDGFGVQRFNIVWTDISQRVPLEPNTDYTLSAYIKWESNAGRLYYYSVGGTKSGTEVTSQVGTTSYKRVFVTFNTLENTPESTCRFECSTADTPFLVYALKLEKGNKPTDWTPAPEDVQTQIDTATTLLADISSDSKLTPNEKVQAKKEWDIITGEYPKYKLQAQGFGVSTSAYDTAYNDLNAYLNTTNTGVIFNLTTTSDIVSATFTAKFKAYYDNQVELINAINSAKAQNAVNNVKVGGRNLVVGSSDVWSEWWIPIADKQNCTINFYNIELGDKKVGDEFTVSLEIEFQKFTYTETGSRYFRFQGSSDGIWTVTNPITYAFGELAMMSLTSGVYKLSQTFKINSEALTSIKVFQFGLRCDYSDGTGKARIRKMKVERGNKATDWTPAPEDVNSKIEANTTSLNVALGKIDSLVKNTTITKDGATVQLKDAYTSTEQTVSGLSTTVASHTTTISNMGTTVESHSTTLEQHDKGISLSVKSEELEDAVKRIYGVEVDVTKESIKTEMSKTYISKDEEDNIVEKAVKYATDQTAEGFEETFNTLEKTISDIDGKLVDEIKERNSYIRRVDGKMYFGDDDPANLKAVLDNDSLDFMQGGVIVSQITNQQMLITDAIVKNKLTLGDTDRGYFDFVPRANGNLSLKWRSN